MRSFCTLVHSDSDQPAEKSGTGLLIALFFIFFSLVLLGAYSRYFGAVAVFWPSNAVFLGLLLKRPDYARQGCIWLLAGTANSLAELWAGHTLLASLLLSLIELGGVAIAYFLVRRQVSKDINLRNPQTLFHLILIVGIACAINALLGASFAHQLYGTPILNSAALWFIADQLAYTAILPVILCAPKFGQNKFKRYLHDLKELDVIHLAPVLLLLLSAMLSLLIGGVGAVAFPVLPLLWCALRYSLFSTSLLTLLFVLWSLTLASLGLLPSGDLQMDQFEAISLRIGIASIALAPMITASMTASRNDAVRELRHLAQHDAMTGLLNKQAFYEKAEQALHSLRKGALPVSVLVLDIDHFKPVNDNFGHAAGDQALHQITRILREELRDTDLCGRLGGEEFGILLNDCGPAQALRIAERIRLHIAGAQLHIDGDIDLHLTISIGIAHTGNTNTVLYTLLRQADKALYRAKQMGRNRCHIYDPASDKSMLA